MDFVLWKLQTLWLAKNQIQHEVKKAEPKTSGQKVYSSLQVYAEIVLSLDQRIKCVWLSFWQVFYSAMALKTFTAWVVSHCQKVSAFIGSLAILF